MPRFPGERAQRTSIAGIFHVTLIEENLDNRLQRRFPTLSRTGCVKRNALLALTNRVLERLQDQRITRRKMAVKRAVCKPRAAHAVGDAERSDAVFANLP
jgi:hypothetical protein